jgi:hypothetical protein
MRAVFFTAALCWGLAMPTTGGASLPPTSADDWSQHDGFSKSAVNYSKNGKGGLSQGQIEE